MHRGSHHQHGSVGSPRVRDIRPKQPHSTPPNSPQELKLVVGPRPPFETLSVGTPGGKAEPSLPAWWARSPLADSSLRDDHPSLKAGSGWGTSVPAPVPSAAVGILFFALRQLLFPVSAAPPSAGRAKAVSPAPPTSERARAAPSCTQRPDLLGKAQPSKPRIPKSLALGQRRSRGGLRVLLPAGRLVM